MPPVVLSLSMAVIVSSTHSCNAWGFRWPWHTWKKRTAMTACCRKRLGEGSSLTWPLSASVTPGVLPDTVYACRWPGACATPGADGPSLQGGGPATWQRGLPEHGSSSSRASLTKGMGLLMRHTVQPQRVAMAREKIRPPLFPQETFLSPFISRRGRGL